MQNIDANAILSPEAIERIVKAVLERLANEDELRTRALRVREAKLADIRAFEEMHNLPHTPTSRERGEHRMATPKHERDG